MPNGDGQLSIKGGGIKPLPPPPPPPPPNETLHSKFHFCNVWSTRASLVICKTLSVFCLHWSAVVSPTTTQPILPHLTVYQNLSRHSEYLGRTLHTLSSWIYYSELFYNVHSCRRCQKESNFVTQHWTIHLLITLFAKWVWIHFNLVKSASINVNFGSTF